ncbi:copper radical oxidase [Coprinopsis marcescibilis]|uniref:Copper radical oxidase n=1 Tax=Coprinopsis marcescibilis TaxID=230819 RepID=A0A5C3LBF0_COPMA|nr:copper radical oxidase [Coprinopsis marcescibilis]
MRNFHPLNRGFCCLVLLYQQFTLSADPAWNGPLLPGSTTNSGNALAIPFTPYYVPPGAKSYDSSSPLIHYVGSWHDSSNVGYIHNSLKSTLQPNDSAVFAFTGTGIEWFGTTDKRHGKANVYIDGNLVRSVDGWSNNDNPRTHQRIFGKLDLASSPHTLKLVNMGGHDGTRGNLMDIDALVVTRGTRSKLLSAVNLKRSSPQGQWTLREQGMTGVNAMQLVVISSTLVLIVDKVEHNPLDVNGHPAWGALYNLETHETTPLNIQSNSFCAGGAFLSNGSLVNVGGNPIVEDYTSSADFGDLDGLQAIRLFHPCNSDTGSGCDFYENHDRIRMASPRWYNTVLRISDGSVMIIGGSKKGGWINNSTVNNPTIEYYPPKNIDGLNGMPVPIQFLQDTLNSNLFPIAFSLPDGRVFIAANRDAMIYDWKANVEQRLPEIPNGIRVTYPMAGTGVLLPLTPDNDYQPEVLLCGGSTIDDTTPGYDISSQDPASGQCSRIVLTDDGISHGWEVEDMPDARLMGDAILLPTGDVLIVNGASSGISGYGNVRDQVGASNADHPAYTPVLYSPSKERGSRFSKDSMPTSQIPRLYHSSATLTPNGDIMIAGSNPNLDRSEITYGTEYRVEWLSPPYMTMERPEITGVPDTLPFGSSINLQARVPTDVNVQVVLMDLGYVTHSVHANSRLVFLKVLEKNAEDIVVEGPPNEGVYPPGPGWIYLVVGGVPSRGVQIMVGGGDDPPFDEEAMRNVLESTTVA